MVKTTIQMRNETREKMRDGNGSIEIQNIFEQDEMFGKSRLCAKMEFDPGDSIGPHPHAQDAEIYYVLSGELTVTENGKESLLRPGDAMIVSQNSVHSIENRTSEKATIFAIVIL